MKIFYLSLSVLFLASTAHAEEACIQTTQPAVSPDGVCEIFSTPCDVPDDWKSIPSCDLVSGEGREARLSLEAKMKKRLETLRKRLAERKANQENGTDGEKAQNRPKRLGSGSFTRQNARYNGLETQAGSGSDRSLRTSTQKNYKNIGLRKYFSQRGGYGDDTEIEDSSETTNLGNERDEPSKNRPAQISATKAKRSGNLKSTVHWNTLSKQHMRPKSYGKNPYSLKSRYAASQKEARDKSNESVDVEKRKMNGYRIWRGEKEDASLEGINTDS